LAVKLNNQPLAAGIANRQLGSAFGTLGLFHGELASDLNESAANRLSFQPANLVLIPEWPRQLPCFINSLKESELVLFETMHVPPDPDHRLGPTAGTGGVKVFPKPADCQFKFWLFDREFPAPQVLEVFETIDVECDLVGDLDLGVPVQSLDETLRPAPRTPSDHVDVRLLFHLRSQNRIVA
jgi:hypothetical protein